MLLKDLPDVVFGIHYGWAQVFVSWFNDEVFVVM
jgi:hypothetical protein